jgi:hypothetical protein
VLNWNRFQSSKLPWPALFPLFHSPSLVALPPPLHAPFTLQRHIQLRDLPPSRRALVQCSSPHRPDNPLPKGPEHLFSFPCPAPSCFHLSTTFHMPQEHRKVRSPQSRLSSAFIQLTSPCSAANVHSATEKECSRKASLNSKRQSPPPPLPSEPSVALSLVPDSAARVRGLSMFENVCSGLVQLYIQSSEARASVHDYQRSQLPLAQCSLPFPSPTPPHSRAPLATRTINITDLDKHPHEVL